MAQLVIIACAVIAFGLSGKLFKMAAVLRKKNLANLGLDVDKYAERKPHAGDPDYEIYMAALQGAYAMLLTGIFFLTTAAIFPFLGTKGSALSHTVGIISGVVMLLIAKRSSLSLWVTAPLGAIAAIGILVNVVLLVTP